MQLCLCLWTYFPILIDSCSQIPITLLYFYCLSSFRSLLQQHAGTKGLVLLCLTYLSRVFTWKTVWLEILDKKSFMQNCGGVLRQGHDIRKQTKNESLHGPPGLQMHSTGRWHLPANAFRQDRLPDFTAMPLKRQRQLRERQCMYYLSVLSSFLF